MNINKDDIKRILVIKFGGVGDVLLSTPVLPNLKKYFPDADIFFLTDRKCREVIKDNPYIKNYLTYELKKGNRPHLFKEIRKQKYDLIIDLYCNPRTAFTVFRSKAKYRVGYNFRFRSYAYNFIVNGRGGNVHNVDFNLDALKIIGVTANEKETHITINSIHREFSNEFISSNNLSGSDLTGIIISGGWESKKYKTKDIIRLIGSLKKIYNTKFLLFWGTEKEKLECQEIIKSFPADCVIVPECTLKYISAVLRKCKATIGNDSGLLHLAAASEVPVLGIYGPTDPKSQGPAGDKNLYIVNDKLDCLNCNLLECPIGNICMTELDTEAIISKYKKLLEINNVTLDTNV